LSPRVPFVSSLVVVAGLACGCSASPPPAAGAPPPQPAFEAAPPPPQDLPAKREAPIGDLLGVAPREAPRSPSATTPPTAAKPETKSAEKSSCGAACAALASMTRSTEHLCTIAGNDDEHCTSARARTARAGEHVHASCPACP
jgi:hypothetical protein